MWKKIHSNRDPRNTLFSELRKEFNVYFVAAGTFGKSFLVRYPKFFFGLMVILMSVSLILSFTLFRHTNVASRKVQPAKVDPMQDGFSEIMQATGKIRTTLRLKLLVDSISGKKQLSPADSIVLDSALSQLQRLHSPSK